MKRYRELLNRVAYSHRLTVRDVVRICHEMTADEQMELIVELALYESDLDFNLRMIKQLFKDMLDADPEGPYVDQLMAELEDMR